MSGSFDNKLGGVPSEIVDPAQFDKRVRLQLLIVLIAALAPFLAYKTYLVVVAGGLSYEELFSLAGIVAFAAVIAYLVGGRLRAFVACAYVRMHTLLQEREKELGVARDKLAEQDLNLLAANRRLEALAQCDPLTGLASRRC
ncbi:MAG TPA: hypothetical protein VLQ65_00005, partial [Saliniramus sp.]|nr:hypothetical protein [Saliniramus sp.]